MKKIVVGLAALAMLTSIGLPNVVTCEEGKDSLERFLNEADLATLQSKYEEAKNHTLMMEEAKTEAESELQNANQRLDSKKAALEAAKNEKKEADQNAGYDSSALENAQKRYDDALKTYELGSAGFFKDLAAQGDHDAQLAYDIITASNNNLQDGNLKTVDYSGYTNLGTINDATDLEHMKKAIDELDQVNVYRRNENNTEGVTLSDLKVTSSLMAISQYQLNYSKDHIGHSQAFNVGENLSWGYTNPFDGWYDEEKEIFKTGGSGETGHYLNIVNTDYTVMGYSYISGGKAAYTNIYGQTFSRNGSKYATNAISVTAYKTKFDAYYGAVKQELDAAKIALDDANAASGPKTPEQIAAEEKLVLAQQEYDDALADVEQASENVQAKMEAWNTAKSEEAAIQTAYEQALKNENNVVTDNKTPFNTTPPSSDNPTTQPAMENKMMAGSVKTGMETNIGVSIYTMAIAGITLMFIMKKSKTYISK